ncbi:MAG: hypothetical protein ACW981_21465 [Candidatus Hodarchaeales archaeon]
MSFDTMTFTLLGSILLVSMSFSKNVDSFSLISDFISGHWELPLGGDSFFQTPYLFYLI